jgi:hypothetical protein
MAGLIPFAIMFVTYCIGLFLRENEVFFVKMRPNCFVQVMNKRGEVLFVRKYGDKKRGIVEKLWGFPFKVPLFSELFSKEFSYVTVEEKEDGKEALFKITHSEFYPLSFTDYVILPDLEYGKDKDGTKSNESSAISGGIKPFIRRIRISHLTVFLNSISGSPLQWYIDITKRMYQITKDHCKLLDYAEFMSSDKELEAKISTETKEEVAFHGLVLEKVVNPNSDVSAKAKEHQEALAEVTLAESRADAVKAEANGEKYRIENTEGLRKEYKKELIREQGKAQGEAYKGLPPSVKVLGSGALPMINIDDEKGSNQEKPSKKKGEK